MADTKITALTALTAADPANDVIPIVDVSDTSMAASGTTKKISVNNILGASGTATLASATITGDLTVDTSTLKVDSTNNRVGIGTATPSDTLSVVGGNASNLLIDNGGQQYTQLTLQRNSALNSGGDILINGTASTMNIRMLAVGSMKFYTSPTAGSPVERYNIDDTGISTWSVAGTTAMTLNSTGLGIGVVPSTHDAGKGLEVGALGNGLWCNNSTFNQLLQNATYNGGWKYAAAASTAASRLEMGGSFGFYIAPAGTAPNAITFGDAKMTLDASGNLYVGKTSSTSASTGCELQTGTGGNAASVFTADGATVSIMNRLTSDGTIIDFRRQTSSVGNIAVTTLATTYNSISDYRLKEAVQPLVGGLARVSALKPSIYKWKVNGSDGEGFLAHELASVVSSAVTGEKDAVNEDGSINAQSIDMSRIVPILVAAIQELTTRVQTLEAR